MCAFLSLNVEEFAALSRNEVALKVGRGGVLGGWGGERVAVSACGQVRVAGLGLRDGYGKSLRESQQVQGSGGMAGLLCCWGPNWAKMRLPRCQVGAPLGAANPPLCSSGRLAS